MKGKILLVCLETEDTKRLYPVFGLMYIADALIKKGYDVKIIHEYSSEEVFKKITYEAKDALFVGFTTMTSPKLKQIAELSKRLKQANVKIVWGGVHASLTAEDTIKNDFIDFIVIGEGEIVMPALAEAITKNKGIEKVNGLMFKKNGKIISNEKCELIKNLDDYKPRWELVDVKRYLGDTKELVLIESRGCPSRCSYCYNLSFNKRLWRAHSADFVVNMVNELRNKYDIRSIAFYSDNFVVNKKRALDIVKRIGLPWSAEIRADYFDDTFIKSLKENNCKKLYIGAESGSDKILEILKKDVKVSQTENAIRIAKENNIDVTCSFMTGIPGETREDRNITLDFIHKILNKYNVDIDGPKFLNPYPGTEIYELCKQKGWRPPNDLIGWANYSRMTYNLPFMGKKEIKEMEKYQRIIAILVYINSRKNLKKLLLPIKKLEDYRMRNKVTFMPVEVYALRFLLGIKSLMR